MAEVKDYIDTPTSNSVEEAIHHLREAFASVKVAQDKSCLFDTTFNTTKQLIDKAINCLESI